MTKELSLWADEYMFKAEEIDPSKGPEVFLISCNNDPLGSIAAAAKAYKGEFIEDLAQITDAERRYYLGEVQKSILEMPLEAVNFHFRIKGVTRGFTHQLVRQRTAAYSQESTRFAVKETVPVGLPPSLVGTDPEGWHKQFDEYIEMHSADIATVLKADKFSRQDIDEKALEYADKYTSQRDKWRQRWDALMKTIETEYNALVNDGMPAEDARGALPTNLLTQVNYFTNLRGLKGHSGMRLCTQAQYEWKQVWAQIIKAIREYGKGQTYQGCDPDMAIYPSYDGHPPVGSSRWQFDALADIFRPVCYYTGKCEFGADFDRKCSIRERVMANHEIARPSTEWGKEYDVVPQDEVVAGYNFDSPQIARTDLGIPVFIPAIKPQEWLLDPAAAR